jgi:hypothetical protein
MVCPWQTLAGPEIGVEALTTILVVAMQPVDKV